MKEFKEIRLYDNGKLEVVDLKPDMTLRNMSIWRCSSGFKNPYTCIKCREADIKKATDKLYRKLRMGLEAEKKALNKRMQAIEKLNHPNILKLSKTK